NPNPLLWILHIALYWVPVAFLFSALANLITLVTDVYFLALDVHVIVLGFVFTILIGFGTRVTLGHSGNKMFADKYTTMLFVWTQVVVALRILTSFAAAFGMNFMILFDITATAWLVMFIAWSVRFLMVLVEGKKLTE
ncbi:NnrS family protein, partial [Sulfurovum lithotrophicum]